MSEAPKVQHSVEHRVTVRHCRSADTDITLAYDTFGDATTGQPLLLVMGMNAQMLFWNREWCEALVARGFYVIRFDNRDVGNSMHLDALPSPSICSLVCCASPGGSCCLKPSYTIEDMAADAIALAETLHLDSFHLCGQSMGGMIAQHIAAMVPDRVRSLTLIYSSPGDPSLSQPTLKTKLAMATEPKDSSRKAFVDNMLTMSRAVFVPEAAWDEEWLAALYGGIFDRSAYMGSVFRQASAVVCQLPRNELCKRLKVPTLVLHGEDDILVGPDHGVALHKLIPGSRLVLVKNMGHGIMPAHVPLMCDAVAEVAGIAGSAKKEPVSA